MVQPADTFSTYDQIGIREDLVDVIYDVSPVETPFLSMAAQLSATNTLHEWQTDSLEAAAANAVIEGDDATTDASTATVRLGNYTQISDKVARVTGTGRAVDTAGRADEMDYQMMKRANELKRDMEKALLDNNARVAGDDSTARELAGVPAWIATNTDFGGGAGADPTGDGTDARTDGDQRSFTEAQLKTVLKEAFDSGGNPDTLLVGAFNRQIVSGFSDGRTNVQKVEDDVLHASFDVYESDFGRLRVIPDRFQRSRDALVLQMDLWAVAFVPGRNMAAWDLAKTGDTDRRQILSEYTLEARNEKGSAIVADLTTS